MIFQSRVPGSAEKHSKVMLKRISEDAADNMSVCLQPERMLHARTMQPTLHLVPCFGWVVAYHDIVDVHLGHLALKEL